MGNRYVKLLSKNPMEGYAALANDEDGAAASQQQQMPRRTSRSGSASKGIKSVHDFIQSTKSWMFDAPNSNAESKRGSTEERVRGRAGSGRSKVSLGLMKGIYLVLCVILVVCIGDNHGFG